MAVTGMHIGGEIATALGLPKETTDIVISIGLDSPVAVICRYFPSEEALQAMAAIIARYHLEPQLDKEPADIFAGDQRRRLFRQSLLRSEAGVESPYLQRYLSYKREATALAQALAKILSLGVQDNVDIITLEERLAHLQSLIERMEAGEAV